MSACAMERVARVRCTTPPSRSNQEPMMTDQNNQHDDLSDSQPEREARRNDEANTIMGQRAGERRREHRRAIELPEPNPVERNLAWFRATGQLPATGEPNIRQAAF